MSRANLTDEDVYKYNKILREIEKETGEQLTHHSKFKFICRMSIHDIDDLNLNQLSRDFGLCRRTIQTYKKEMVAFDKVLDRYKN